MGQGPGKKFDKEIVVHVRKFGGIGNFSHFGHAAVKRSGPEFKNAMLGRNSTSISRRPGKGAGTSDSFRKQSATLNFGFNSDGSAELKEDTRRLPAGGAGTEIPVHRGTQGPGGVLRGAGRSR